MDDKSDNLKDKSLFLLIKKKIGKLKRVFGVVDKKAPISFELSEFMQETESAMLRLPSNYKKLYESTPIEPSLFVNREKEIAELQKSFTNWTKNRFVTCAIIGEKGCGVSSTLNSFLDTIPNTDLIRSELHEKIYTKEDYFNYFNTLLKTKDITTNEGLIDFLNDTQSAKIIILENLHHMFLKKVGGFESIKTLFELISYTTKKVLWIGVFTPRSWYFLDKTISISNYFTSEIFMEPLTLQNIKEIIFKRNEHENLNIEFLSKEESIKSRIYENLEDEQRQSLLEERFFKLLHKLSNGNISLALLYWARAIEKLDKQTLFVTEIDDFDYSFIKNLSPEALFALQALVLHDGLTLHDFSIVMNESLEKSRKMLMPMLEKGMLIQPHKKYNINPAVYKQVDDYLSSKNFIH
ncbi:hypothetical protein [Sulfurimonas sp.]|jgi:hypothetical protein|uniref:hypothetical protein n=1 Tax=Sulfurimonas sp. TaxID=2022749 RepID=UPI0025F839A3|nr:hypothetical protein [Sulfurimonas sp.]MCK9472856.1 hypothetical protein [Sulfurimonas sp.]MDD3504943.1 hypothetical protein [Sulfurimonas sp.]